MPKTPRPANWRSMTHADRVAWLGMNDPTSAAYQDREQAEALNRQAATATTRSTPPTAANVQQQNAQTDPREGGPLGGVTRYPAEQIDASAVPRVAINGAEEATYTDEELAGLLLLKLFHIIRRLL